MARRRAVKENSPAQPSRGPQRWMLAAGGILLLALMIWAIAGDYAPAVFGTFGYAHFTLPLLFTLPVFAAAWMVGLLFTEPLAARGLFADSPWPDAYRSIVAAALGLGAFSLATLLLGAVHLIEPAGNSWPVLLVPLGGIVAGLGATRRFLGAMKRGVLTARPHKGEWLLLAAAVPVAILLIAATFPPGTLWHTEANGYDALEYHLQLPREYALDNSTAPLAHNVYSYLPANVEMLYLLQMQFAKTVLGNDRSISYIFGAFPAQFAHVLLMLLTAAAIALMPLGKREQAWLHVTGRAIAVLLFLGTPWTLVTGSLAYNEGGMMLFGTLALAVAYNGCRGAGLLAGILLGLAVGCKMTAGVFFALPVALLFAMRAFTDGTQWKALGIAVLAALALYAPWAARAAWFSGGNPVFPVAGSVLGADHWTPQQVERFARGHSAPDAMPATERLGKLADNSVFDSQWSVQLLKMLHDEEEAGTRPATAPASAAGSEPAASPEAEPWWRRLGTIWWAMPLALACAFISKAGRGRSAVVLAVLAVQIVAWLYATHLQARFLLPAVVPLALLAGRGVQGLQLSAEGLPISAMRLIAGTVIVLHALFTGLLLWPEAGLLHGTSPRGRETEPLPIGEIAPQPVYLDVAATVEKIPPGGEAPTRKVLLVGDSTAFRYFGDVAYSTVFDGDPFVRNIADPAAEAAWLRREHVDYVLINWTEILRFRRTYGFEGTMSVEDMKQRVKALAAAGIVHVDGDERYEVLRVTQPN